MQNLEIILVVVLLVILAALFVLSYLKKKKFNDKLMTLREELKVGDKVMTDSGVVGEFVETFKDGDYDYAVLKSGRGEHIGYFTVHVNAIYYVFGKDDAVKHDTEKKRVVVVPPKVDDNQQHVENNNEQK